MRYGNDSSGQGMDHVAEVKHVAYCWQHVVYDWNMWQIDGICGLWMEHVAYS
jgi:hypothetical protein